MPALWLAPRRLRHRTLGLALWIGLVSSAHANAGMPDASVTLEISEPTASWFQLAESQGELNPPGAGHASYLKATLYSIECRRAGLWRLWSWQCTLRGTSGSVESRHSWWRDDDRSLLEMLRYYHESVDGLLPPAHLVVTNLTLYCWTDQATEQRFCDLSLPPRPRDRDGRLLKPNTAR